MTESEIKKEAEKTIEEYCFLFPGGTADLYILRNVIQSVLVRVHDEAIEEAARANAYLNSNEDSKRILALKLTPSTPKETHEI